MEKMNKKEKKEYISEKIDLANGRYKDNEVDKLYDLVKNSDEYVGATKTYKSSHDGWSSEGKYTRKEEASYTLCEGKDGMYIEEEWKYNDDDGQSGGDTWIHDTGRAILNLLDKVL